MICFILLLIDAPYSFVLFKCPSMDVRKDKIFVIIMFSQPSHCTHFYSQSQTYSSHCKSRVSLTLSRKQPSECMLSNTSGSSSVSDEIRLTHTRLGGGCSGHGSLRPPLKATHTHTHRETRGTDVMMLHSAIQDAETERILTDTRHVSGWPLAVRGDREDGVISWCSLLAARWPQRSAVQTVCTTYIS